MIKNALVPLLLVSLMAACSKKEEAPAPAPAPAAAPAPAPAPEPAPAPAAAGASAAAPATETASAPGAAASASGNATASASSGGTTVAASGDAAKGEQVFKTTCSVCHATGTAGAPKFGDKADWGPRIAQGKDTLYTHALQGFTGKKGTMPPKGGNTSLSDADVKAAVDYMVSKAQ